MATETHARSLLKTASYRLLGSFATASITLILTRQWKISITLGLFDLTVKILLYYLHERLWNIIPLGKKDKDPIDYQI